VSEGARYGIKLSFWTATNEWRWAVTHKGNELQYGYRELRCDAVTDAEMAKWWLRSADEMEDLR